MIEESKNEDFIEKYSKEIPNALKVIFVIEFFTICCSTKPLNETLVVIYNAFRLFRAETYAQRNN